MSGKLVYHGRLFRLYEEKVRLPNGVVTRLEVIHHPGAALIVPFAREDTVLLLRQFRYAAGTYLYEFPAGTRERGESALSCAKREIIEETGYAARRFRVLGDIFPVPGYSTERIRLFRADSLVKRKPALEADEVAQVLAVDKKRMASLVKAGRIKDAKTLCALALIGWMR